MAEPKRRGRPTKKEILDNKSFKEELAQTIERIQLYKIGCEANVVSMFWKKPDLLFEYDNVKLEDFSENQWRVFFEIINNIVINENKPNFTDIEVGLYLEQHDKLRANFTSYGGMETIQRAGAYVKEENIDGYVRDLHKWNSVIELAKKGFPVNARLSDFSDMQIDDIYNEYEAYLNHIFANADANIKSYDISDKIMELIDELDNGEAVGLPLNHMPLLNNELGGFRRGDITLIGGVSNSGKSSFLRIAFLSSILMENERIVIFLNEEGLKKWQREMLVWVANTQLKKELPKHTVRDGKYTPETRKILEESAQWLIDKRDKKQITIIPLEKYSTAMVGKLIKKYASLGIVYFAIDTFKMDNMDGSVVNENTRLQMVQNMTTLYNTVKESCKNVCLICTVQLTKGSSKMRYLMQDAIGESKNIVDPCATVLLVRNIFEDEYEGGGKPIKVFKPPYEGSKQKNNIPEKMEPGKHYQIIFIAKSRESSAGMGSRQFVVEVDYSKNIMKEVGFTNITPDF